MLAPPSQFRSRAPLFVSREKRLGSVPIGPRRRIKSAVPMPIRHRSTSSPTTMSSSCHRRGPSTSTSTSTSSSSSSSSSPLATVAASLLLCAAILSFAPFARAASDFVAPGAVMQQQQQQQQQHQQKETKAPALAPPPSRSKGFARSARGREGDGSSIVNRASTPPSSLEIIRGSVRVSDGDTIEITTTATTTTATSTGKKESEERKKEKIERGEEMRDGEKKRVGRNGENTRSLVMMKREKQKKRGQGSKEIKE